MINVYKDEKSKFPHKKSNLDAYNWVIIGLFGILILSSLKYDIISSLFSFNHYQLIIIGFIIFILIIRDLIKNYNIKNINLRNLSNRDEEIELRVNAIENTIKSVDNLIRYITSETDTKDEYIESAKNQLSFAQKSINKVQDNLKNLNQP